MTKPVTLIEAIRRAGLSQAQVARMANVNESIVSRACNGQRAVSLENAVAIARAVRLPVESIDWSRTR